MLGRLADDGLLLEEVHRFHYPPAERNGHLRWDVEGIWAGIREGLRAARVAAARHGGQLSSLGVDSWGVDYGLVDSEGRLLEEPTCYRDPQRTALMAGVLERVPRDEMFERTGIQFLPFNTVYQLYAHVQEGIPSGAAALLDDARPLSRPAHRHRPRRVHERLDHPAPRTRAPAPGTTLSSTPSAFRAS